jgi:hypothetical protein
MKKANPKDADELRPEYKRPDFGLMVRGKYAALPHQRSPQPKVSGPEEPPAWRDQGGGGEPD